MDEQLVSKEYRLSFRVLMRDGSIRYGSFNGFMDSEEAALECASAIAGPFVEYSIHRIETTKVADHHG